MLKPNQAMSFLDEGELRLTKKASNETASSSDEEDEEDYNEEDYDDEDDDFKEEWADYPAWGFDKRGLGSIV